MLPRYRNSYIGSVLPVGIHGVIVLTIVDRVSAG
jgi:hypothetical protein